MSNSNLQLPGRISALIPALARLYEAQEKRELQEILVNAQTRVHEEWSYDNWDGGTYGHALYLQIPETLYLRLLSAKEELQTIIRSDLNSLHNFQNESIEEVFFEIEPTNDPDWRQKSGLLLTGKRTVDPNTADRIWGDGYRVFLSHKTEVKVETKALKDALAKFRVSCFVAHEDIKPTKEWQNEIESALTTMDAFVALLTENFHESDWTDQEVGFALARNVPIISVRLERDPYGFLGKFQGLKCSWENAPNEVAKLLIRHNGMFSSYIKALHTCGSYIEANELAKLLPEIAQLTEVQIDGLVKAHNDNGEIRESFGFKGGRDYGKGLLHYLNLWSNRKFGINYNGKITEALQNE